MACLSAVTLDMKEIYKTKFNDAQLKNAFFAFNRRVALQLHHCTQRWNSRMHACTCPLNRVATGTLELKSMGVPNAPDASTDPAVGCAVCSALSRR
jgi:hypothetical protein